MQLIFCQHERYSHGFRRRLRRWPLDSQVSFGPDPHGNVARRRILRLIGAGLLLFIGLAGVRLLVIGPDWTRRVMGIVCIAIGAWRIALTALWLRARRRETVRLRAGQCVWCGYLMRGVPSGKCPECGRDPIGTM